MYGAAESGICSDTENVISTFPSHAAVSALLKLNADSIEPGIFLKGDTWVVSSEHPESLVLARSTMGGELWPADFQLFDGG